MHGLADGVASNAAFYHPTSVAVGESVPGRTTLYVTDQFNHRIRKVVVDLSKLDAVPTQPWWAGLSTPTVVLLLAIAAALVALSLRRKTPLTLPPPSPTKRKAI